MVIRVTADTLRSQRVEVTSCAAVAEQEEAGRVHRPPPVGDHVSGLFQKYKATLSQS